MKYISSSFVAWCAREVFIEVEKHHITFTEPGVTLSRGLWVDREGDKVEDEREKGLVWSTMSSSNTRMSSFATWEVVACISMTY